MDFNNARFDIMRRMFDLTKDESLCDLSLSVSGEMFKVHKFVMAASSKKIHHLIKEMKPNRGNKVPVLKITDITPKGMKLVIDYVYSGNLPSADDDEALTELRNACKVLEVEVQGLPEETPSDEGLVEKKKDASTDDNPEIFIEVTTFPVSQDMENSNTTIVRNSGDENETVDVEYLPALNKRSKKSRYPVKLPSLSTAIVKVEPNVGNDDVIDMNSRSEVVVQIVGDKETDSDEDYVPDPVEAEEELNEDNREQSKGTKKRTSNKVIGTVPEKKIKSEYVVNGMDISQLFTTKKRDETNVKVPPAVPDPSLALKRGRPRLPNDYLFPNSPPYICPHKDCTKECDTREKLKKHYRSHDERTHLCETCSKRFLYRKDLICHFRTHTGEKPFKCEVCGKGFSQKATLQYHMKMHDDTRMEYFCEECGKHYKTFKGLQNHIEKTHGTGTEKFFMPDIGLLQNPVMCPVCSVRFRTYRSMYQHMKRQHPDAEEIKQMPKLKNLKKPKAESQGIVRDKSRTEIDASQDDTAMQEIEVGLDDDDAASFFCMSCSLSFRNEATFAKHSQKCEKDTIQLLFICGYCKQCFESDDLRKEHIAANHKKANKTFEVIEATVATHDVDETENIENVRILNLESIF